MTGCTGARCLIIIVVEFSFHVTLRYLKSHFWIKTGELSHDRPIMVLEPVAE